MRWDIDLSGHTAVITGGTRNIGLAIAQALKAQGARVCVVGGSDAGALASALSALGGENDGVTGLLASIAEEAGVKAVFDHAEARLGPVSILINGAANRPHKAFVDITREEWDRVLATVLTGPFMLTQQLFRRLPDGKKGAVVNIGGLSAHRPAVERPHVIAGKSGLVGLTKATAAEGLGRIRANIIIPGAIETTRKPGQSVPHSSQELGVVPPGSPEDVARAVLPFADPSDSYVTGQSVHVNGGRYMP
ncbi:MAG: SDR family oxidoreductase [Marinobacter sp.]|jgi:3-oxoacyl-[acyl-carrier protein] reductase